MSAEGTKAFTPIVHWDETLLPYFTAAFGPSGLAKLSAALCRPPLSNSFRIDTDRVSPAEALKQLSVRSSSVRSEDLNSWSRHPLVHDILLQHGSGPHSINYEDTAGKEVVISRRAAEAVLRGAHVFVPGVMACSQELCKGDVVAVCIAMEAPGSQGYITRGSIVGSNLPAISSLYIGKGTAQFSRQDMFKQLGGIGVEMTERVFRLQPCHGLLPGLAMLQNLPSAAVAHVLNPVPGSRVLDMCASPGGKSTHLAQLMKDKGCVIALDRTHAKAQQIRNLAAELGLHSVEAYKIDATTAVQQAETERQPDMVEGASGGQQAMNDKERMRQERKTKARAMHGQAPVQPRDLSFQPICKGFPPESFEYILLDAPCSALGLRPRLTHHISLSQLRQTAMYQRKLLQVAVQLLKPGGHLVYSTCTVNPGENEANVNFVLQSFAKMQLVPQEPHLAGPGLTGHYTHEDGYREEWLLPAQAQLVQRFDPCSIADTIGFFIAKFCKLPD